MTNNKQIKKVPSTAFRAVFGDAEIGTNGENAKTAPIKMLARTGDPIEHWYWGKVVHDMAGMKLVKSRLPIDYCHDDEEVIGYLNKFDTSSGDLITSGALVPYTNDPEDKASEVIYKAQNGIPYEASINFGGDGIVIEQIPEGVQVNVNNRTFQGPLTIIREWPLRGVAVCPYGADQCTESELSSQSDLEVTFLNQEINSMSDNTQVAEVAPTVETTEAKVETETKPDPATVEAAELAQPQAKPHDKFVAKFGDKGAAWFLAGLTFEAALEKRLDETVAELGAANTKIAELNQAIDGLKTSRGNAAATFTNVTDPASERPSGIPIRRK